MHPCPQSRGSEASHSASRCEHGQLDDATVIDTPADGVSILALSSTARLLIVVAVVGPLVQV